MIRFAFISLTILLHGDMATVREALPLVSDHMGLPSLCRRGEFVIANCPVGRKFASVCGPRQGLAMYRFGKPDRVEQTAGRLRHTSMPSPGGGETQIYFERGSYTYFLFDDMTRTGFVTTNDPVFTSGLVVEHKGRFRRLSSCPGMDPVIISGKVRDYMPEGTFIEHWGPTTWEEYQKPM